MKKLIKLQYAYYVVDPSKEAIGAFGFDLETKELLRINKSEWTHDLKLITHSTQHLDGVIQIRKSEVEEVVQGYSVENLFRKTTAGFVWICGGREEAFEFYSKGFGEAQELNKDKLFTIEDARNILMSAIQYGQGLTEPTSEKQSYNQLKKIVIWIDSKLNNLLPKTEWDIEIDSNNKITVNGLAKLPNRKAKWNYKT